MTQEEVLAQGTRIENDRYILLKDGRVYSCSAAKFLKPLLNKKTGYLYYDMRYTIDKPKDAGRVRNIHRLIAETYIPNPKQNKYVNHIDKDRTNNSISNLEWVSSSYNNLHSLYSAEKGHKTISACIQLTDTEEIVETFDSIKSASIKTGINKSNISAVCCGLRGKAGGFKWKYLYPDMSRRSRKSS